MKTGTRTPRKSFPSPPLRSPMAPPARPCHRDAPPTAQAILPDHLVEDILLRLPTCADLARASMAGASLHRVIADHSFLRRFRTLRPPPLLGIISVDFIPAQPPHPSASARALADADFSCSFLPSSERERWHRCDFRDGRALLFTDRDGVPALDKNLAVCDPFHRHYLLLPAIPQDLAALAPDTLKFEPFLAPAGEDEGDIVDAPFSFRVMCLARSATKFVLFVFSSPTGQWEAVTFDGWSALFPWRGGARASTLVTRRGCYYAHGCICWVLPLINKLLMFDMRKAEFSSLKLPPGNLCCQMAFVEAREGRLGMITLSRHNQDGACHLSYAILQSNGDGANQWQTEDVIPLPCNWFYNIIGAAGGYLLVQGYAENRSLMIPSSERLELDCFSLNLQTLKLERFCRTRQNFLHAQLYVGFPPSLSPPTV